MPCAKRILGVVSSLFSAIPESKKGPPASQKEHRTAETKGAGRGWAACHIEETCSPPQKYIYIYYMFMKLDTKKLLIPEGVAPSREISERKVLLLCCFLLFSAETVGCIHSQMTAHTSWTIHVLITVIVVGFRLKVGNPMTPKLEYV